MNSAPCDEVTRFIRYRTRGYNENTKRIFPQVFMPDKGVRSVFCISGIPKCKIWDIAFNNKIKPLRARADILVRCIKESGLDLDIDNDPPGHANIIGFPKGKQEQLTFAQQLALASKLEIYSD